MLIHAHTHTYTHSPLRTQQCGQRPHVLLHQGVDLLLGEASDAVAVHLPAHHAAVQVAQQPLQSVAQRAAHRQELLSFLQVVHPLTVGYRPERTHTQETTPCYNWIPACVSEGMGQVVIPLFAQCSRAPLYHLSGVETCLEIRRSSSLHFFSSEHSNVAHL